MDHLFKKYAMDHTGILTPQEQLVENVFFL